eukprot:3387879-Alexandrium_andersonii.AAC.1
MTPATLAAEMACDRCHCQHCARQEHAASQAGARQEHAVGRLLHRSEPRHYANDRSAARQTHAASHRPADVHELSAA